MPAAETRRHGGRHMLSRMLYWDQHASSGQASYALDVLRLRRPPRLNGEIVTAIDYSPLAHLQLVLMPGGMWRELTRAEMDDIDHRLEKMIVDGLAVWE